MAEAAATHGAFRSPAGPNRNLALREVQSEIKVIGDAPDVKRMQQAIATLEKTQIGKALSQAIRDNKTSIKFGQIDAAAQYHKVWNEITISANYRGTAPSVLAAHLAHEGTHVQWHSQGIGNSVHQEYHAFKNEKEVWDEVKGEIVDGQCDWVSAMIEQGEADAKMEIRLRYPNLPEYA